MSERELTKPSLEGDALCSWDIFLRGYLPFALIVAPPILLFFYVHFYGVNVLHWDEWAYVHVYRSFSSGRLNWWALFKSHNGEHHMFFPVVVTLFIEHLTHFNVKAEMYCAVILQVLSFILMVLMAAPSLPMNKYWLWHLVPLSFFMFSLDHEMSVLFGVLLGYFMITFFSLLAISLLSRCARDGAHSQRGKAGALGAAVLSGFIASFSSVPGLLVWPAGWVYLWLRERQRLRPAWKDWRIVVWTGASLSVVILYLQTLGIQNIGENSDHEKPREILRLIAGHPLDSLRYCLGLIGSIFIHQTPERVVIVGVILLAATGLAFVGIARSPNRSEYAFPVALMAFGLLYVGLLLGRIHSGLDTVIGSDYSYYTTYIIPLVAGLYLSSINLAHKNLSSMSKRILGVVWTIFCALLILNNTCYGIRYGQDKRFQRYVGIAVLSDYAHQPLFKINRFLTNSSDLSQFLSRADYLRQNKLSSFYGDQLKLPFDVQARMWPPAEYAVLEGQYPEYALALRRLWDVYLMAPDIQDAFDQRSASFTSDLLQWAGGEAVTKGYYLHPYLAQFGESYISLVAKAPWKPRCPSAYRRFESSNPTYRSALDHLWHVYLMASDLQKAFSVRSPTFTRDLILWTAGAVKTRGYYLDPYLQKFRKEYVSLGRLAAASNGGPL